MSGIEAKGPIVTRAFTFREPGFKRETGLWGVRRLLLKFLVGLPIPWLLLCLVAGWKGFVIAAEVVLPVVLLSSLLIGLGWQLGLRSEKGRKYLDAEWLYTFTESSIDWKVNQAKTFSLPWDEVLTVHQGGGWTILQRGDRRPIIRVPDSAFESREDLQRFRTLIQRKRALMKSDLAVEFRLLLAGFRSGKTRNKIKFREQ